MNDDGIKDLVVGDRGGYVYYFTRNEDGELHAEGAFPDVWVNLNSGPAIGDWNADGLLDMLVGCQGVHPSYGVINVFINKGTKTAPIFSGTGVILDNNNDWIYHYRAQPQIFDLDSDGTIELVVGETDGKIYYHENLGTNAAPIIPQGVPTGIQVGGDSRVSICDWNEDRVWDCVVGDYSKNVFLFLGDGPTSNKPIGAINNMSNNQFTAQYLKQTSSLSIDFEIYLQQRIELKLYTSDGKCIQSISTSCSKGCNTVNMPVNTLCKGMYVLQLNSNTINTYQKVALY